MFNAEKFPTLGVWGDDPATGATHMAADEAMLRLARFPMLRWYRWAQPEISFGYPMRWAEMEPVAAGRPAIRRWTGGGIVEHGGDLTIAIAVPAEYSRDSPAEFYERIHRAIAQALNASSAQLAIGSATPAGAACFSNPVCHDVLLDNRKVAGGAIRRCREGMLYQGSIQAVKIPRDFIPRLAEILSVNVTGWQPAPEFRTLADALHTSRYGTRRWLEKR
jgi:lipoate-protein ligase A